MKIFHTAAYRVLLLSILLLSHTNNAVSQEVGFYTDFSKDNGGTIQAVTTQADGKIIIAGWFTDEGPGVSRLNSDGSFDNSFDLVSASFNSILSLDVQDDGDILLAGNFSAIGGTSGLLRNKVARLNSDGSIDLTFNPNANNQVNDILELPDGKILVSGRFTNIAGHARTRIARLNSDGSLDLSFNNLSVNNTIESLTVLNDGKILISGVFTSVAGVSRSKVARLNSDGTLDTTFGNPDVSGTVYDVAVQNDGKIIIGGAFSSIGQYVRLNIARLNNDGSLDLNYNPVANDWVLHLSLQEDGKLILTGFFTTIGAGQYQRFRIARLEVNGNLDMGFTDSLSNNKIVNDLSVQEDGKLLIAGNFLQFGDTNIKFLARLNADGSLDWVEPEQCFPITTKNGSTSIACL